MISLIRGTTIDRYEHSIVVEAHSIGYELFVTHPAQYELQKPLTLYVHTHWHQENGISLFGFNHTHEKLIFLQLIDCQGIGPKLALTALAHATPDIIVQAITEQNSNALSLIPGIGKKKAELVVLHLQSKITKLIEKGLLAVNKGNDYGTKISEVLQSLEYNRTEISYALEFIRKPALKDCSFDELLRKTLHFLSQTKKQLSS